MFVRPRNESVSPSPAPVVVSAVVSVAMSAPLCRNCLRLWASERPEVKRLPPRRRRRARWAGAGALPLDERDERPKARGREQGPDRAGAGGAGARRGGKGGGGLGGEAGG